VKLAGLAPVLLVPDVQIAADHYRDRLGFEVDFYERHPEHYAYARRDDCYIHFACFEGAPARPNVEVVPPDMFDVYLYVDDVAALFEELTGRGADLLHGPVDQGYGLREIRVRDPHGYILAFGQRVT
jgi:catechol 2,3-dioxygenase-like lactoylglutathione lyase family enzyme